MHDQPIDQNNLSQTTMEHFDRNLDQRILRALETVPGPNIQAGFAARVASQLPARPTVSPTPTHYGQKAMLIAMVVTLAALLVLAMQPAAHATFGLVETLLCAEFIALVVWISVWRYGLR
jgi:hypothetical protein